MGRGGEKEGKKGYLRTYLCVASEEVISEAIVGLEHVGLDATRWFHSHLGAVLEDRDGELGTGHARQPQTEVTMDLKGLKGVFRALALVLF